MTSSPDTLVALALEGIKLAIRLYQQLGGPPIDLQKLALDCKREQDRIDAQQSKDEAAENKVAASDS